MQSFGIVINRANHWSMEPPNIYGVKAIFKKSYKRWL